MPTEAFTKAARLSPVRGACPEDDCGFSISKPTGLSRTIIRKTNKGRKLCGNMVRRTRKFWKITPAMVLEWRALANRLAEEYPSQNRGFPKGRRRVYQVIAQMYDVDLRTVYHYMSHTENRSCKSPVYVKRRYERLYRHLTRHVDSILPQTFNGNDELSLAEISGRIANMIGVSVRERTLEKLLARYEGKPRGPPALKTEKGYRLNPSYYSDQRTSSQLPGP